MPVFHQHLQTGLPWYDPHPTWHARLTHLIGNFASASFIGTLRLLRLDAALMLVAAAYAALPELRRHPRAISVPKLGPAAVSFTFAAAAVIVAWLSNSGYMFAFLPLGWVTLSYAVVAAARWFGSELRFGTLAKPVVVAFAAAIACAAIVLDARHAVALGHAPKSGIRELVAAERAHSGDTLYLLVPDYLAVTFGYYAAGITPIQFHGFVRWDRPEIFSPIGYAAEWKRPSAAMEVEDRIRSAHDVRFIDLIVEDRELHDEGLMAYSRAKRFVADLRAAYPLILERRFSGQRSPWCFTGSRWNGHLGVESSGEG